LYVGANSALGIGRATCHQFAQNGAKAIFMCDYNDDLLAHHKKEIYSLYPKTEIHTKKFDASDEAAVKAVVEEALKLYGRLDVFFANAGISGTPSIFMDTEVEDFMRMMKTNTLRYVAVKVDRSEDIGTNNVGLVSSSQPNTQQKPCFKTSPTQAVP
jgi:NAD(P)-dependent dehydrogenase (short-subunit alcohol dehydrogenase family)